jgi:Domain of unknown function (DUF4276)
MKGCHWAGSGIAITLTRGKIMHLEFLIEDSSGERLLQSLLPKLLGDYGSPHTWRVHAYKGIGRVPKGLSKTSEPAKRMLLDQLPRLLRGYGQSSGFDAVIVILDSDRQDCRLFLTELQAVLAACRPAPNVLFRLAIEEMEAWYFGDQKALIEAYPKAKMDLLNRYKQDSICGTWECLADALYPGGIAAIKKAGWPLPGQIKSDWAEKIGPLLDPDRNNSPSFKKLRDGIRRLIS